MGDEVAAVVWHLIFKLAPREADVQKVLKIFSEPEGKVDWEKYFSPLKPYESFYFLYIAEALLADSSDSEVAQIRKEILSEERQIWKKNFVLYGGLDWSIKVIN